MSDHNELILALTGKLAEACYAGGQTDAALSEVQDELDSTVEELIAARASLANKDAAIKDLLANNTSQRRHIGELEKIAYRLESRVRDQAKRIGELDPFYYSFRCIPFPLSGVIW